ncbi:MAG: glucuronate isomerase [Bacteroidota bacterium]
MVPLYLHEDRFFDPDPAIRSVARELYAATRALPLVAPHGHVAPELLAENAPFPDPATLFIKPDHYIFRMLYAQGVSMESLGVPTRDGTPVETDPRVIWRRFAAHYYLFAGTPTRAWLDYQLAKVFEVPVALDADSADLVYNHLAERLTEPAFRPRALYERFGLEVLTTTDAATDDLRHHQALRDEGWGGRVRPCFRPDALFRIAQPEWGQHLHALEARQEAQLGSYAAFREALWDRRQAFKALGAFATDHAVVDPYTHRLADADAEVLYQRALGGTATVADQAAFEAHLLMEMAAMSTEDGLVMQLHPGSYRDHNGPVAERFGPDMGADIPVATEYTRNLHALLNAYGNHPNLTLVLFTLDEAAYSRELAPLAGHYPALRLGPPWWFHDSIEGMLRFRQQTSETAGLYNTAGFNDDTRAFCSIPARHDLARRVDATFLARLVARHQLTEREAHRLARALAYDLVRQTYRLDQEE